MGDAVIRSMYIVYDLDQGQMSFAQAKLSSTTSNVKEVQAGPGGVSKAAGARAAASSQSYSIAPSVTANASFSVSTAKSAVGTATGEAAVPTAAQVSSQGGGGGSGGSGNSKSAASTIITPQPSWTGLYTIGTAALMAIFGAALLL